MDYRGAPAPNEHYHPLDVVLFQNDEGQTALMEATKRRGICFLHLGHCPPPLNWGIVDLLLENNADTTITNKLGKTAAQANPDVAAHLNGGLFHKGVIGLVNIVNWPVFTGLSCIFGVQHRQCQGSQ